MPSVAAVPAAPVVGAAADWPAALQAPIASLEAQCPPRSVPALVALAPVSATVALARAHAAYFDARAARYALRDDCRPQPDRFAQLRAAIIRCRETRAAFAAAAAAFHASPAGATLRAARTQYPLF
ncbi:hypothetical protein [Hymenobacter sp.]|uniref:hypothetical protein n=1 Tax=Hymenobacter sp. TaxID=1898978 RepID=UPI002EDB7A04